MDRATIRQQIHKLIDEANENQLEAVLEVLTMALYSKDELNSFYKRDQLFEESGNKGYSIEESHTLIRNKYKERGI